MDETQIRQLSGRLKELNELLEKILHAQFGIEDKRWIDAMQTIENGFMEAVTFIAEVKGKTSLPTMLLKEDIDKILND